LLSVQTSLGAKSFINWTALTNHEANAVTFEPQPMNIFGISITQVSDLDHFFRFIKCKARTL